MIGFKAFNKDLSCRGFNYEIGKAYEFDGKPIPCKQGFHFCKTIAETYIYYDKSDNTRICRVEALGDIVTDDNIKFCTNKIKICEEITEEWERKGNAITTSTGYCNTGNRNTGDWNTGNRNTGDWNTGNRNTGNRNTGDCNTGNRNTGNRNTGNRNTGNRNTGNRNTGNRNTGDCNTGDCNTGDWNTGYCNTGDCNTGNCNTGDWNTGYCNTGDCNTGDWNISNHNTGIFNIDNHSIMMFDKPSDWTYDQWKFSDARKILSRIDKNVVEWIGEDEMTDEEKELNPSYKTTGGYLKVLDEKENIKLWWDNLTQEELKAIRSLPNYDEEKFKKCIGLD